MLTPINILTASILGTLPASIGISLFTPLHNEAGGHNHCISKGIITAILYALFEMGAINVAGQSFESSTLINQVSNEHNNVRWTTTLVP